MGLWSVKLICFYHLSWIVQADRQHPRIAVHPLDFLCLSSQVWRTIFSSVWAAALMCAMFFTCSSSFHFISWAGLLWRSAIWLMCLCVFGCFWVDLRSCFYFFSLLKENPLGFYKPSVPHSLTAQTYLNGKQYLFDCSLIPIKKKKVFINFNGTVWKEKFLITRISIDSPWIRKAVNAMYNCITWLILWVLCISLSIFFLSFYCSVLLSIGGSLCRVPN